MKSANPKVGSSWKSGWQKRASAADVVKYWVDTFAKVLKDPAVVEAHEKGGLTIDYMDDKALDNLIKAQDVFARDVISKLYK